MTEQLADKFKNKFGGNTKAITSLASSIKRTKTALNDIQIQFLKSGEISEQDKEVFLSAIVILQRLGSVADKAKLNVKHHAAEKLKFQEKLMKESIEAVNKVFMSEHIDDVVALLAWENKSKGYALTTWREYLKKEMFFDSSRHKHHAPNVIRELKELNRNLINDLIQDVANKAEVYGRSVDEIIQEMESDFNISRQFLLEKERNLIGEIKTAAVAQSLEANQVKNNTN
jgi:hypothetical protein